MSMSEITICKTSNALEYLPQIDRNEADSDFIHAVSENNEDVYSILHQESIVGLALMEGDSYAFLYIYIFPVYRHRGFGKAAALLLEQKLCTYSPVEISTCYRNDDSVAYAFAKGCGYIKEFSSDYMTYSGPGFELATVPVRPYQDQDYLEAYSLSAEAFHLMRLSTGCFPDSVPESPSEEARKCWADTADERLVYMIGEKIVGCAHVQGSEISSISVKPNCQGKGVGKAFLKYIVNMLINTGCTSISLYCVVGNYRARHLYDELGFIRVYRNDYAKKKIRVEA